MAGIVLLYPVDTYVYKVEEGETGWEVIIPEPLDPVHAS